VGYLIDLGVAKTNKYASRESGDTVEVVERPAGGLSVVVADGQGSGRAAKALSLLVTAKATTMLQDGVRDGAVARGVSDALFAMRHGQVSATLDILSVDPRAELLLATRWSSAPMLAGGAGALAIVPCASGPLGVRGLARPEVRSWPLAAGFWVIVATDGVAGSLAAEDRNLLALACRLSLEAEAQAVADGLLRQAIARDNGKPRDDMSVVALRIGEHADDPRIRRLAVRMPLP
jgi:serine phosphatase RsbU (regulator of sigma subunit)